MACPTDTDKADTQKTRQEKPSSFFNILAAGEQSYVAIKKIFKYT